MRTTRQRFSRAEPAWAFWTFLTLGMGAVAWRLSISLPGLDHTGWRVALDSLTTLAWFFFSLVLALGVGRRLLRAWLLGKLDLLEKALLAGGLGAGVLSSGVFILALTSLLSRTSVLLLMAGAALVTWQDCTAVLRCAGAALRQFPGWLGKLALWQRGVAVYGLVTCGLTGFLALAPPTHYDALMYHIPAAWQFLDAERFILLPDTWQANLPFAGELLFILGLVVDSHAYAGLVHMAFGGILVGVTSALARRLAAPKVGWVAVVALMGVWAVPLWSAFALVDLAWAAYIGLAGLALVYWWQNQDVRWLALGAVFTGLALGVKAPAVYNGLALGLWVLWVSRKQGFRTFARHALVFGGISLAVGLPWYLKSWVLSGNPIYPAFFGGPGWDSERVGLLQAYLAQFGGRDTWWEYLVLPVSLYLNPAPFATLQMYETMSWLFPLALMYPFFHRRSGMDQLGWLAIGQYLAWLPGSLQIRFLLPLSPFLAVLAGDVFIQLVDAPRFRQILRPLGGLLLAGVMVVSLVFQFLAFSFFAPVDVVVGLESRREFLSRTVDNYPAWDMISRDLPASSVVLAMWDGRTLYCEACLPDGDQARWTRLYLSNPSVDEMTTALHASGVTHLLLSKGDADFFARRLSMDSHAQALEFFTEEYKPACTRTLYEDEHTLLTAITCLDQ